VQAGIHIEERFSDPSENARNLLSPKRLCNITCQTTPIGQKISALHPVDYEQIAVTATATFRYAIVTGGWFGAYFLVSAQDRAGF
jgi:hypothetical protein